MKLTFILILFVLCIVRADTECHGTHECEIGDYCNKEINKCVPFPNKDKFPKIVKEYEKYDVPAVEVGPRFTPFIHHHTHGRTCGNSHMSQYPKKSHHHSESIPTCGESECDNVSTRDSYATANGVIYIQVNHIVFNCTPSWYSVAKSRIATGMAECNKQWSGSGYQFTSTISYFPCVYQGVDYTTITTDQATQAVLTIRGTSFRTNKELYLVTGTPTEQGLAGFFFFPSSSYSGSGFITSSEYASGKSTIGHELGHGFGLRHTFAGYNEVSGSGSTCSSCLEKAGQGDIRGDFCDDTSFAPNTFSCSSTLTASGSLADPCSPARTSWPNPVTNIMSYCDDSCGSKSFSTKQLRRMRCFYDKELLWLQGINRTAPGEPDSVATCTISTLLALVIFFVQLF